MAIIRGTTPTIIFTFSEINISDIVKAYIIIKQMGQIVIERDISTADQNADSLSWKLTQAETLSLAPMRQSEIYCDWVLNSGTRGRSKLHLENTENSGKNEVI